MLDLSVIIITWNMRSMLEGLLESLGRHTTGIVYETIVIDNASEDGTSEMVRKKFPSVRLVGNTENRGVAAARNQGFQLASGRYLMTLDADMLLVENSLATLVRFMDEMTNAGVCGCKLVATDGSVQPSARRFPTPAAFLMRRLDVLPFVKNGSVLRRHEMAEWDRSDNRAVDYVIGACQVIRREAMEQVGVLDEHIFYGPEDLDYCLRMQNHGWKVFFVADTRIIHYEQRATRKRLLSRLSLRHLAGIFYLFKKHKGRLTVHHGA